MVKVHISDENVRFEIQGLYVFLAMRRQLTVARQHITDVRIESLPRFGLHGIRAPGTHLPGVIVAGTFHQGDGRSFYCVTRFAKALIVELINEPYRRLVINVDDEDAVARQLLSEA